MRIVHLVCSSGFAGVEKSLTYVTPELARRGHDVTVIGGAPQHMAEPLASSDVTFIPAASALDAIKALRLVSRVPVDVVHSHMTAADLVGVVNRSKVRPLRVSTLHFAQPRGRTPFRRQAYRGLPAHLDVQIAISQYVAAHCATPTVVIPNGIPDPGFSTTERDRVVLMAQRLEAEKNTRLALEAWAVCPLPRQGWQLHIAGDGSELPALAEYVHRLRLTASVRLLGFVDDVRDRMQRASLFLATAPSEPFGLAVVEAMAVGLPVAAAKGGAHSEVLANTGRQFDRDDVVACSTCLTGLSVDPVERARIAITQRERYESEFRIERQVDALLRTYADHAQSERRDGRRNGHRTGSWR